MKISIDKSNAVLNVKLDEYIMKIFLFNICNVLKWFTQVPVML